MTDMERPSIACVHDGLDGATRTASAAQLMRYCHGPEPRGFAHRDHFFAARSEIIPCCRAEQGIGCKPLIVLHDLRPKWHEQTLIREYFANVAARSQKRTATQIPPKIVEEKTCPAKSTWR